MAMLEHCLPQAIDEEEDRRFHVIITAEGPAPHWQSRLHYYWCAAQDRSLVTLQPCVVQHDTHGLCQHASVRYTRLLAGIRR